MIALGLGWGLLGAIALCFIKPRIPVMRNTAKAAVSRRRFDASFLKRSSFWAFGACILASSCGNFLPSVFLPQYAHEIGSKPDGTSLIAIMNGASRAMPPCPIAQRTDAFRHRASFERSRPFAARLADRPDSAPNRRPRLVPRRRPLVGLSLGLCRVQRNARRLCSHLWPVLATSSCFYPFRYTTDASFHLLHRTALGFTSVWTKLITVVSSASTLRLRPACSLACPDPSSLFHRLISLQRTILVCPRFSLPCTPAPGASAPSPRARSPRPCLLRRALTAPREPTAGTMDRSWSTRAAPWRSARLPAASTASEPAGRAPSSSSKRYPGRGRSPSCTTCRASHDFDCSIGLRRKPKALHVGRRDAPSCHLAQRRASGPCAGSAPGEVEG
jgi:hypothetical protein